MNFKSITCSIIRCQASRLRWSWIQISTGTILCPFWFPFHSNSLDAEGTRGRQQTSVIHVLIKSMAETTLPRNVRVRVRLVMWGWRDMPAFEIHGPGQRVECVLGFVGGGRRQWGRRWRGRRENVGEGDMVCVTCSEEDIVDAWDGCQFKCYHHFMLHISLLWVHTFITFDNNLEILCGE